MELPIKRLTLIAILFFLATTNTASALTWSIPKTIVVRNGMKVHYGSYWLNTTGTNMHVTRFFNQSWLNYTVDGAGTQEIYQGSQPSSVYLDGVNKTLGDGWTYSTGKVTVTGATSNAQLYYGSGGAEAFDVVSALSIAFALSTIRRMATTIVNSIDVAMSILTQQQKNMFAVSSVNVAATLETLKQSTITMTENLQVALSVLTILPSDVVVSFVESYVWERLGGALTLFAAIGIAGFATTIILCFFNPKLAVTILAVTILALIGLAVMTVISASSFQIDLSPST